MTEAFNQSDYKTFEFDWTGIDPEYQWVAVDQDGSVAVFNHRPVWVDTYCEWMYPNSDYNKYLHIRKTHSGFSGSGAHLMKLSLIHI